MDQRVLERTKIALGVQIVYALFLTTVLFRPISQPASENPSLIPIALYYALSVALAPLTFILVYAPIRRELGSRAAWPSLTLGVLSIPGGGVISGILLILVYREIRGQPVRVPPLPPER